MESCKKYRIKKEYFRTEYLEMWKKIFLKCGFRVDEDYKYIYVQPSNDTDSKDFLKEIVWFEDDLFTTFDDDEEEEE